MEVINRLKQLEVPIDLDELLANEHDMPGIITSLIQQTLTVLPSERITIERVLTLLLDNSNNSDNNNDFAADVIHSDSSRL